MTEVLTPEQRFLRRTWLLEKLPEYAAEAAYHRTHKGAEDQIVYMLWRLDTPRGSLNLGEPVLDWQMLGDNLRASHASEEAVAALLAVLVLNNYRGATPELVPDPHAITMRWRLEGISFAMTVTPQDVTIDYGGPEYQTLSWTDPLVAEAFDKVRKASSVVS